MVAAPSQPASKLPTVLLTGFDAFGGEAVNPSWLAVQALHGRRIAGHRLVAAHLPTVFGAALTPAERVDAPAPAGAGDLRRAGRRARRAVAGARGHQPRRRAHPRQRRRARPIDSPVVPGGPGRLLHDAAHQGDAWLALQRRRALPPRCRRRAGTFVCNHVFYGLMHALATQRGYRNTRGGFVHLPLAAGAGHTVDGACKTWSAACGWPCEPR